jgi:hypothetical protein
LAEPIFKNVIEQLQPFKQGTPEAEAWLQGAVMGALMDGLDSLAIMLGQLRGGDDLPKLGRQSNGDLRRRCRVTAYPYIFPAMQYLEEQGVVEIAKSQKRNGRRTTVYLFKGERLPAEEEILRAVMRAVREGRVSYTDDIYYPQPRNPQPEEMPAA